MKSSFKNKKYINSEIEISNNQKIQVLTNQTKQYKHFLYKISLLLNINPFYIELYIKTKTNQNLIQVDSKFDETLGNIFKNQSEVSLKLKTSTKKKEESKEILDYQDEVFCGLCYKSKSEYIHIEIQNVVCMNCIKHQENIEKYIKIDNSNKKEAIQELFNKIHKKYKQNTMLLPKSSMIDKSLLVIYNDIERMINQVNNHLQEKVFFSDEFEICVDLLFRIDDLIKKLNENQMNNKDSISKKILFSNENISEVNVNDNYNFIMELEEKTKKFQNKKLLSPISISISNEDRSIIKNSQMNNFISSETEKKYGEKIRNNNPQQSIIGNSKQKTNIINDFQLKNIQKNHIPQNLIMNKSQIHIDHLKSNSLDMYSLLSNQTNSYETKPEVTFDKSKDYINYLRLLNKMDKSHLTNTKNLSIDFSKKETKISINDTISSMNMSNRLNVDLNSQIDNIKRYYNINKSKFEKYKKGLFMKRED